MALDPLYVYTKGAEVFKNVKEDGHFTRRTTSTNALMSAPIGEVLEIYVTIQYKNPKSAHRHHLICTRRSQRTRKYLDRTQTWNCCKRPLKPWNHKIKSHYPIFVENSKNIKVQLSALVYDEDLEDLKLRTIAHIASLEESTECTPTKDNSKSSSTHWSNVLQSRWGWAFSSRSELNSHLASHLHSNWRVTQMVSMKEQKCGCSCFNERPPSPT